MRADAIMLVGVLAFLTIGGAILYAVSLLFHPLWLLLIIPLWILYAVIKKSIMRTFSLRRYGYFGGGYSHGASIYEEYIRGKLMQLKIKLGNTEPGHWELFVPTETEWRSTMPAWAVERREEIIQRIAPHFKNTDVHYPDDFRRKQ